MKSKFFRVFTEGDTTDGRVIQRSWIEQIAKTYSQAKYGARIWLEHMRGTLPDSPFKAYGDVVAVKAEEVEVDGQKKLALFAQLDATDELVAMNKKRQKVYTSVEVDPNFAKSGEAYLVGLAVTDSPASLGTEMLAFAAGATVNPLAERKQGPDNLFTVAQEVSLEFEDTATESPGDTLYAKVKALLGFEKKDSEGRFADVGQAVEAIAISQKESITSFAILEKGLEEMRALVKINTDAMAEHSKEFADLKTLLEKTPDGSQTRPAAAGGNGEEKTDC